MPANQATRWLAPAAPVFAGKPAPTPTAQGDCPALGLRSRIGNKVRERVTFPVGAGVPAKQATRWLAPAAPVIAGKPACMVRLEGRRRDKASF